MPPPRAAGTRHSIECLREPRLALAVDTRVSSNGKTTASQAVNVGSIPITRSNPLRACSYSSHSIGSTDIRPTPMRRPAPVSGSVS